MGRLIVIEGLDGSGKATQAKRLVQSLQEDGYSVMHVSFPDYKSPSSALVTMYLNGEFGDKPDDVNAFAASAFYAVDRYASFKKNWGEFYRKGGIIVADRYLTSNAVHQCAKLPESKWQDYLDWLYDFEVNLLGLPAPDQTIYLKVDPHVSQKLMSERYAGDESKKDIHEKNLDYMRQCQRSAAYCSKELQWTTIQCDNGDTMRSIEDIQNELKEVVYSNLK